MVSQGRLRLHPGLNHRLHPTDARSSGTRAPRPLRWFTPCPAPALLPALSATGQTHSPSLMPLGLGTGCPEGLGASFGLRPGIPSSVRPAPLAGAAKEPGGLPSLTHMPPRDSAHTGLQLQPGRHWAAGYLKISPSEGILQKFGTGQFLTKNKRGGEEVGRSNASSQEQATLSCSPQDLCAKS